MSCRPVSLSILRHVCHALQLSSFTPSRLQFLPPQSVQEVLWNRHFAPHRHYRCRFRSTAFALRCCFSPEQRNIRFVFCSIHLLMMPPPLPSVVAARIVKSWPVCDQSDNVTLRRASSSNQRMWLSLADVCLFHRHYGEAHLGYMPKNAVMIVKGDIITNSMRYI